MGVHSDREAMYVKCRNAPITATIRAYTGCRCSSPNRTDVRNTPPHSPYRAHSPRPRNPRHHSSSTTPGPTPTASTVSHAGHGANTPFRAAAPGSGRAPAISSRTAIPDGRMMNPGTIITTSRTWVRGGRRSPICRFQSGPIRRGTTRAMRTSDVTCAPSMAHARAELIWGGSGCCSAAGVVVVLPRAASWSLANCSGLSDRTAATENATPPNSTAPNTCAARNATHHRTASSNPGRGRGAGGGSTRSTIGGSGGAGSDMRSSCSGAALPPYPRTRPAATGRVSESVWKVVRSLRERFGRIPQ